MEKFYAGFWVRLFAGLLDLIFLTPLCLIIIYIFGDSSFSSFNFSNSSQSFSYAAAETQSKFIDYIIYGISVLYMAYFLASKKQATLGKRIMGIYVANSDGSKLSVAKSIARAGATLVTAATLGFGFFIVIFTKEKISLHDFLCDTRVFHGRKNG